MHEPNTESPPQIADHVLLRRIGSGAYGEVWLAKNVIGGFRAVKVIHRRTFSDDRPFVREFEGICKFEPISRQHSGLVTILQVGKNVAEGYFYYVMELADDLSTGQKIDTAAYAPRTLRQEMTLHKPMPLAESLRIGLSLTSALGQLHEHGLIHRDIKPSNIIFVNGTPKFADIGLVTEAGDDLSEVGSRGYMPPEGPHDASGDIYSLGKVFYELFMGKPCKAFPEPPDFTEEWKAVPALQQINNIILRACRFNPKERFQNARALSEALILASKDVKDFQPPEHVQIWPDPEPPKQVAEPTTATEAGPPPVGGGQPPKARRLRMAAMRAVLRAIAGAAFLFMKSRNPGSVVPPHDPVLVLMDTTASNGVYRLENVAIGASNAKDVSDVLREEDVLPPGSTLHQEPLYAGWARETPVISQHPDLVIVHRSSFHHSYNAVFNFGSPTNNFKQPAEDPQWQFLYDYVADDRLITLLGLIGNEVPQTKFLIYSRGTDTNWLRDDFRAEWVTKVEARFPKLKGRINTMVISREKKGSFYNSETRELLRSNVIEILKLPKKREPEKRN